MKSRTKYLLKFISFSIFLISVSGPLFVLLSGEIKVDKKWHEADRSSSFIAPDPARATEAIVQFYSARAFSWRGMFAVHTWLVSKEKNAKQFKVHHVVGWNEWRKLPVVVSRSDIPDRSWYGHQPVVIKDIRGAAAEKIINQLDIVIKEYPYPYNYTVWPGPNSNTFIAHIAREIPELSLALPPIAIGKDYLPNGGMIDKPPSGKGLQLSLFGLLGLIISPVEGLELNILGLVYGISFFPVTIKIPGIGSIGS